MGRTQWARWAVIALSIVTPAAAADRLRTAVIAAGDCPNPELDANVGRFEKKLGGQRAVSVVGEAELLKRVGREPSKSVEELQRQIEGARQLFHRSQHRQAMKDLRATVEEIARLDPGERRWQLEVSARLLDALVDSQLPGKKGTDEAFGRVLRLDPTYKLDRDQFTPSLVQRFEKLRRKMASARRGALEVTSSPSDAEVFLEGRSVGRTPYRGSFPEGSYQLQVGKDGTSSLQRDVRVPARRAVHVDLQFESTVLGARSLCLADAPDQNAALSSAVKLGSMLDLDQLVLLRMERPRQDRSALGITVVDVSAGRSIRASSLPMEGGAASDTGLAELARFVTTGEEMPSRDAPERSSAAASAPVNSVAPAQSTQLRPVTVADRGAAERAPSQHAASPGPAATESPDNPYWRADLTYALSGRASYTDQGLFDSSFAGFAPSYLRLDGAWYRGRQPPGLVADLRIEWFQVAGKALDGVTPVSRLAVPYSASVGAGAQWLPFSWLRLEGALGYGASGMWPTIYSATKQEVLPALLSYHGPVLSVGATATVNAPHFAELRASALPFSSGGSLDGADWRAEHVSLGLRAGVVAFSYSGLRFVGTAEYEFHRARGVSVPVPGTVDQPQSSVSQTSHRVGVGLRVTPLQDPPSLFRPPAGPGRIRGRVLAQGTPNSIAGAEVVVGGRPPVRTDRSGYFVVPAVDPGPVSIEVRVAGYRTSRETVEIQPGVEFHHSLQLVRKSGPGTIKGKVVSRAESGPGDAIAGAEIRAQSGATATSSEDGSFVLPNVGPGAVTLVVNARNHQAAEEIVSVPPETDAEVELVLAKAAATSQASIRGQVRSAKGGAAVKATLMIREAKVNARADRDGRFTVRVPGGRYTLVFSARGYTPQTKVVDLADGDQALFYIDLSPGEE
jgi:hypothetical protein